MLPEKYDDAKGAGSGKEEDDVHREVRLKKRQAKKAGEVVQFEVEASPVGGSFTLNYSRNVFSGRPANDPALSEWNSEGYHPSLPVSEPRSVRLEVTTTVGFDLSLSWNVIGLRQVGEFTRMGLGLSVVGNAGLMMTFSWRRLGQRINIPITLCPTEMVTSNVAALAITVPWLTYSAVEFGLLRPRERRRQRRRIAQRRKELKKSIPKRREESRQTVELMTEQVRRRQSREEAKGGLVINKAEFGYIPTNEKAKDNAEVIEVTIPVAALVDHSQLTIPRETVKVSLIMNWIMLSIHLLTHCMI